MCLHCAIANVVVVVAKHAARAYTCIPPKYSRCIPASLAVHVPDFILASLGTFSKVKYLFEEQDRQINGLSALNPICP